MVIKRSHGRCQKVSHNFLTTPNVLLSNTVIKNIPKILFLESLFLVFSLKVNLTMTVSINNDCSNESSYPLITRYWYYKKKIIHSFKNIYFSKNTKNCFAYISATKYPTEDVLYSKGMGGHLLSPHIKIFSVALLLLFYNFSFPCDFMFQEHISAPH